MRSSQLPRAILVVVGSFTLLTGCSGDRNSRKELPADSPADFALAEVTATPILMARSELPPATEDHPTTAEAMGQANLLRSKGLESPSAFGSGAPKTASNRVAFAAAADEPRLPPKSPSQMRIHALPVGAGSCALVECPGSTRGFMLIDCGSTEADTAAFDANLVRDYVAEIVDGNKIAVVVSHADRDHYSHIPHAVSPGTVSTLWLGGELGSYPTSLLTWVNEVRDHGTAANPIVVDQLPVNWHNDGFSVDQLACGTAPTYVLGVNNGTSKNDHSLMLSVDHGEFRAVFSGDATGKSQDAAIANYPGGLLVSSVVMASHHGASSCRSNNPTWIAEVQPQYIVYSSGNGYGHPRCSVVEDYRAAGTLVPVDSHSFRCGDSTGYQPTARSDVAEFNTHTSGVVVITSNSTLSDTTVQCLPGPC